MCNTIIIMPCWDSRVGRGGKVNITLFFSIFFRDNFSKSFLYLIPRNMHISLNRDCCTCVGPCMMKCNSAIFGGVAKGSPLTARGWHYKVTFLPVANSIMTLSKEPYGQKLRFNYNNLPYQVGTALYQPYSETRTRYKLRLFWSFEQH